MLSARTVCHCAASFASGTLLRSLRCFFFAVRRILRLALLGLDLFAAGIRHLRHGVILGFRYRSKMDRDGRTGKQEAVWHGGARPRLH